jgi:ABC-2 type transport system permease protein
MRTPESVMQMSMMVLFPLVFCTDIWVPADTMPGWLQAVVDVNPVTKVVDAVKGLMMGNVTAGDVGWALLACAAVFAIFTPITMRLYNRKLQS